MSRRTLWLGAAVVLLGVNLRPGASAIGPLLAEIRADLGLSAGLASGLTALPGFCFAIFGALAVGIAARVGLTRALAGSAICITVGLLARSIIGSEWPFLALSVLAIAGMAVANVLVPGYIRRTFPGQVPALTSAYSTSLAGGATLAVGLAAPLAARLPGGWRASLAVWGVTALLAAVGWIAVAIVTGRRERHTASVAGADPVAVTDSARLPMWAAARSPKAWALAVFFGTQSTQAYVQFGWLPQMYRDGGLSPQAAGLMLSVVAGFGIPVSLLMPLLVARVPDLRPLIALLGVLLAVGYAGVLLAPTKMPWVWASALGVSGAAFPLAIALITLRTGDPAVTTSVSGFVQSVGYLLAGIGPFAIGLLHDAAGGWTAPLVLLAACGLPLALAGMRAGSPGLIDTELAHPWSAGN